MPKRKSVVFRRFAAAIALFLLAGCATVTGPRQVTIPVEQLQQSLARKFPLSQRYLDLVNVRVSNPRLQIPAGSNRIVTTLDAAVSPVPAARQMTGTFTLSGVPVVDVARNVVLLREPRMEKLTLDGINDTLTLQLAKIGDALAQKILADLPIYQFDATQLAQGGVQYVATGITPAAQAIMVTFEPAK